MRRAWPISVAGIVAIIVLPAVVFWQYTARVARTPQDEDILFVAADPSAVPQSKQPDRVLRYRYVTINAEALADWVSRIPEIEPGGSVTANLSLFDDTELPLEISTRQHIPSSEGGKMTMLRGGVANDPYSVAVLTVTNGELFAKITLTGKSFRVVPINPPLHRIDQLDPDQETNTKKLD